MGGSSHRRREELTMDRVNYDDLEADKYGNDFFYWKGKPFTGIAFELHPNGQLSCEVEMVEGMANGFVREWFPSGQLKLEGYETLSGPFSSRSWSREWFPNGTLKRETTSEDGVRIKETIWNEAGALVSTYERPTSGKSQSVTSVRPA
jgi:antitoxin component YwqK of YwqJK toxin-antitoxin module